MFAGKRKRRERELETRLRQCLGAADVHEKGELTAQGCRARTGLHAAAKRERTAAVGEASAAVGMGLPAAAGELFAAAGEELERSACRDRIGFEAFVHRLIRYDGLRIWFCQAAMLAAGCLLLGLYFRGAFGDFTARGTAMYLSAFSSLAALLSFPLAGRRRNGGMRETEQAARFGGGRLAAARTILTGVGNLAVLCIVFALRLGTRGVHGGGAEILEAVCGNGGLVLYLLIPFLGSGWLGAWLERILPERWRSLCRGCTLLAAPGGIALLGRYVPECFEGTFSGGWACVCAALFLLYLDQLCRQCRMACRTDRADVEWAV